MLKLQCVNELFHTWQRTIEELTFCIDTIVHHHFVQFSFALFRWHFFRENNSGGFNVPSIVVCNTTLNVLAITNLKHVWTVMQEHWIMQNVNEVLHWFGLCVTNSVCSFNEVFICCLGHLECLFVMATSSFFAVDLLLDDFVIFVVYISPFYALEKIWPINVGITLACLIPRFLDHLIADRDPLDLVFFHGCCLR